MVAISVPNVSRETELDNAVRRVKQGSEALARLSLSERIHLAEQMLEGFRQVSEDVVLAACQAKGIDPHSPVSGEEWLAGPVITLRILRQTIDTLKELQRKGSPRIDPSWVSNLADGRLSVRAFPLNAMDAVLLGKHTAEVHFQPGVSADNLAQHQASFYRKPHGGRLCAVLGAGNVNSIPPADCITKLFNEGTACVLKMNPVNGYLGPLLEKAFAAAIRQGFLAVVYGGAEEGTFLVQHPLVDEVHITGSDRTHDALVWGTGPEGEARRAERRPLLKKQITSELGNITPVIVIPGPYESNELSFQADSVAGMVANNASFNCNSAKLLVTPKGSEVRGQFIEKVAAGLGRAPVRTAYYPGASERWHAFTDGRPHVQKIGNAGPGQLPYALVTDVDPSVKDDRTFHQEPWCTVLSEVALAEEDPLAFLKSAVEFVNERVWGTLCCMLVVHPKSLKDPLFLTAFEEAVRQLRYGTVAINTWPATAFGLGSVPWGGHPSARLENIQSGLGFVHNTLMFENIEKAVVQGPLKGLPVPPWYPGHRNIHNLARRLAEFEYDPSWLKIPPIAAAAFRP